MRETMRSRSGGAKYGGAWANAVADISAAKTKGIAEIVLGVLPAIVSILLSFTRADG